MFKKSFAFGLLATATMISGFVPAAHANEVQINKQDGAQSAAAIGEGNAVFQNLDQSSYQNQVGFPGYPGHYPQPVDPQVQVSAQDGKQSGAAVGKNNAVIQDMDQTNWQDQLKF